MRLVIGTRKSKLALWQTHYVKARLEALHPAFTIEIQHIVTRGDTTQAKDQPLPEIGGKGLFTAELEEALRKHEIDIAVHSLKDLPTDVDPFFTLGAIPERESPFDALLTRRGEMFEHLASGAVIGSSSVRRASQLLRLRPDLKIESIRGNVDTRISKLRDEPRRYDAIVLAHAGLKRLERDGEITQLFSVEEMLPAPGQGALAVQCRAGDKATREVLHGIHHEATALAVTVERQFLATLNAGCNTPVACLAEVRDGRILFRGRCLSPDGSRCIELGSEDLTGNAAALGKEMGEQALGQGFNELASS